MIKKGTTFFVLGFLVIFLIAGCDSGKTTDLQEKIKKTDKDLQQVAPVKKESKKKSTGDVADGSKDKKSLNEIKASKEASLVKTLDQASESGRNDALRILGEFKTLSPTTLKKLHDMMQKEESPGIRRKITGILKKFNVVDEFVIKEYVRQLREDEGFLEMDEYPASFNALKEIGEPAVLYITELLSDKSRTTQWWAAFLLEKMGTKAKSALTALIDYMKKVKDPRIQVLCIQILGKIRDHRAIPVLEKALQSPFEYVLIAALDALYQTRGEEAFSILTLTFQHPINDALPKALKELEIKESFMPIFLMALESPAVELKLISMESLKKMLKTHSYKKKIESAIEEAIKSIKNGENPEQYIKKVIEEMDKEFPFRGQFERLVADAKSGSHKAMQTLVDFLQLDWRDSHFISLCDELAEIGKPVVPMLIEALKNSKGEPLRNILTAVARMGPMARDAVPLLTKIIKQGDEIEQRYAQLALDRIQGKPVRK